MNHIKKSVKLVKHRDTINHDIIPFHLRNADHLDDLKALIKALGPISKETVSVRLIKKIMQVGNAKAKHIYDLSIKHDIIDLKRKGKI